mgnify:FL=1
MQQDNVKQSEITKESSKPAQKDAEKSRKAKEAQAHITGLDSAGKKNLLNAFEATQPAIVAEQLRKSGTRSKMVSVLLEKYVIENVLPHL